MDVLAKSRIHIILSLQMTLEGQDQKPIFAQVIKEVGFLDEDVMIHKGTDIQSYVTFASYC